MQPEELKLCTVESDKIGIVTTLDGVPLPEGEIAGSFIKGHEKFQNGQRFIDEGGYRGLQEEFLGSGAWSLNPWFVEVKQVPLTEISTGTVGVIISHVGNNPDQDNNSSQYRLVSNGYKGVENIPIGAGIHPINTEVKSIEIVPTHEITLNWTDENKPRSNYDANLKTLQLRSKDGFTFGIEVTQVISIAPEDAPKMISRVGSPMVEGIDASEDSHLISNQPSKAVKYSSIKNLVARVLEPMVGNYFRNSAQNYEALDFLEKRSEIQRGAIDHIKTALTEYGVQADKGTFINEIDLPKELEEELKKRKIAKEQRETYKEEILTEQQRQNLIEVQEQTKSQAKLVQAQQNVKIADLEAQASIKDAEAKAAAKRLMDDVDLQTRQEQLNMYAQQQERLRNIEINELRERIQALSPDLYAKIESEKAWSQALAQLKIDMPEIFIGGSSGNSSGIDALQAGTMQFAWMDMLRDTLKQRQPQQMNMPKVEVLNPASDND